MSDAIYGSDFSAAESANIQMQAARRQALQHSEELLQHSYDNMIRVGQERAKLLQSYVGMSQQHEQQARTYGLTKQYYDWLTSQPSASGTRSYDFKFNAAAQDAAQGNIDSPEHAQKNYGLHPDDAQMMWERSKTVRPQIENEYGVSAHIADALNRKNELTGYVAASKDAAEGATHFYGNDTAQDAQGKSYKVPDYENQRIKDWNEELAGIPSYNLNDKRIASLVTFNPDSGQYEPTISKPHWLGKPQAAAATSGTGNSMPSGGNLQTPSDDDMGPPPGGAALPAPSGNRSLPWDSGFDNEDVAGQASATNRLTPEQRMAITQPVAARRRFMADNGEGTPPNTVPNLGIPITDAVQRLRALRTVAGSGAASQPASTNKILIRTSDGQLWRLPTNQLEAVQKRDPKAQVLSE